MAKPLPDASLDQAFRTARTRRGWTDEEVPEVLIRAVYDLLKWAPTSGNTCPARFVFIRSAEAKARLDPLMDKGNREQTMAAPWTVLVAYDLDFPEYAEKLISHAKDPKSWFKDPDEARFLAVQGGTLQGGYLIIAARMLGLDCGPMNGFDREGINREFFETDPVMKSWRINFVCNLGHGDDTKLHGRAPRLDFDEACRII
jgi:3-hydroxypropanoate dehydrogenase